MLRKLISLTAFSFALWTSIAHSAVYQIDYTFDFVGSYANTPAPDDFSETCRVRTLDGADKTFGCDTQVGDTARGYLRTGRPLEKYRDGIWAFKPKSYITTFGDIVWDSTEPSDLVGFRGPAQKYTPLGTPDANIQILDNPDTLGVEVENGIIKRLVGGVYGGGDLPHLDYLEVANGSARFLAWYDLWIEGTYTITRVRGVPEPAGVFLLSVGLLGMAFSRDRGLKNRFLNPPRPLI